MPMCRSLFIFHLLLECSAKCLVVFEFSDAFVFSSTSVLDEGLNVDSDAKTEKAEDRHGHQAEEDDKAEGSVLLASVDISKHCCHHQEGCEA